MLDEINSVIELEKEPHLDKNTIDHPETVEAGKLRNEKYTEAINELSKAIRLNPKEFKLYFYRATLKIHFGDIDGARQDFKLCEEYYHMTKDNSEDYPLV